jgi:hypothetical protein
VNSKPVKERLKAYSKEVLIEYIAKRMHIDFGMLELIKSEMNLDSLDVLLPQSEKAAKEFFDLVQMMQQEKDPKKLEVIVSSMENKKAEMEKLDKKINKILDVKIEA